MKKNITLIIMLIMVIILVALSLILGFKYVNNKKNLEKLNFHIKSIYFVENAYSTTSSCD